MSYNRINSSVNARSMRKAVREFKRRCLDIDYEGAQILGEFYADIQNRFFSAFMNPMSRLTSYFLIDCDTPEEYAAAIKIDRELLLYEYPTRNGMHILTHPFNPETYPTIKDMIKKDDLIFIK